MTRSASPGWTFAGLAIALLGIPLIVAAHRLLAPDPAAAGGIVLREAAILGLAAVLLWLIGARERLGLGSIGFRRTGVGRSLAWGLGLAIASFAAVVGCLLAFSALGIRYGEGAPIAHSLPVTLLTVIRAGVAEELFYRGYAIERLHGLTGSRWTAAALSLAAFAGFHYRQGAPGIVLALVLGGLITLFYLWKRNLLAAMFAHFLVDFVPNVLVPLAGGE